MADDRIIHTNDSDRIHVQEVRKDVQVREVRPGELADQPLEIRKTEAERLTEREAARARLKASVDVLAERANLQVQMQKEPLKMIGGASAVGAVLGLVVGRQFRRSKKIYVDADSPAKDQKALMKAQKKQGGQSLGGALMAAAIPLAVRLITDKFVTPRLEEMSSGLRDRAANPGAPRPVTIDAGTDHIDTRKPVRETPSGSSVYLTPAAQGVVAPQPLHSAQTVSGAQAGLGRPVDAFLKREEKVARVEAHTAAVPDPKAEAPKPALQTPPTALLATSHGAQTRNLGQAVSALFQTGAEVQPGAVKPTHPGVVTLPESRVDAKAVSTALADFERANPNAANPNAGATALTNAAAGRTGPTGPVVAPVHPGVVRMPESQVEAKAVGTALSDTERGNPNAS